MPATDDAARVSVGCAAAAAGGTFSEDCRPPGMSRYTENVLALSLCCAVCALRMPNPGGGGCPCCCGCIIVFMISPRTGLIAVVEEAAAVEADLCMAAAFPR